MPFGLSPDALLAIGTLLVTWICGLEAGASLVANPAPSLPDHIMAAAQQLGELHQAHERAKTARAEVQSKLSAHIETLKRIFHLE